MEIETARKIVSACLDTKYWLMGLKDGDDYIPLPKVSLEEMLVANRVVSDAGSTPDPKGGGSTIHMVIDHRGVAAMYVREMYRHNAGDALEAMGWTLKDEEESEDEDG